MTYLRFSSDELLQVPVEGEIGMSRKTLQELIKSSLSIVKKHFTSLVKIMSQLFPRERLEREREYHTALLPSDPATPLFPLY